MLGLGTPEGGSPAAPAPCAPVPAPFWEGDIRRSRSPPVTGRKLHYGSSQSELHCGAAPHEPARSAARLSSCPLTLPRVLGEQRSGTAPWGCIRDLGNGAVCGEAAKTPAGAGDRVQRVPAADVPFHADVPLLCQCCLFLLTWGQLSPAALGRSIPRRAAAWPGEGMGAGRGKSPQTRPMTCSPSHGAVGSVGSVQHTSAAPWEPGGSGKRRAGVRGTQAGFLLLPGCLPAPLRSCLHPQLTRTATPFLRHRCSPGIAVPGLPPSLPSPQPEQNRARCHRREPAVPAHPALTFVPRG